ncbi:hypothetical protein [Azohydromonas aeria]|uniref:hypothetical protein n=1 Tax=Azohydromonas aeria TaxID=2590212 RepID=UPI0012F84457|nr:hypothetical protein [Azohydromonas aeria]
MSRMPAPCSAFKGLGHPVAAGQGGRACRCGGIAFRVANEKSPLLRAFLWALGTWGQVTSA